MRVQGGRASSQEPSPPEVRALLRRFGLRPRKGLGQNFLLDQNALRRVVGAADLIGEERVLEIGAGLGSLTYWLAREAREVLAVEVDEQLLPALEHGLAGVENVRLIVADVLELDLNRVTEGQPYVVVANIPYNITSVLIRKLLEAKNPPERMVLTLQREVAERIVAPAGDMSLLALGVQVYGDPSIVARIPASAFYPQPNVDSAILRVEIRDPPKVARDLIRPLFMLARAGFGQRRKQLHNALSGGLGLGREETAHLLLEAGIDPRKRAQALTVAEWGRLAQTFAKRRGEG